MRSSKTRLFPFLVIAASSTFLAAALAASGCGDDTVTVTHHDSGTADGTFPESGSGGDGSPGGDDSSTGQPGVTYKITYKGTAVGPLHVAAFQVLGSPPAYGQNPGAQTYPFTFHFPDTFVPGDYYAGVYIDVGNNNQTGPGKEDPHNAPPVPFTVTSSDEVVVVNVDLNADPSAVDAGSDADAD